MYFGLFALLLLPCLPLAVAGAGDCTKPCKHGACHAGEVEYAVLLQNRMARNTTKAQLSNAREASAGIQKKGHYDIPMSPWMGVCDRARLYALLANATNYREFGAGGSTVQAATFKNIKKILSSESDPEFATELLSRHDLQHEVGDGRLFLQYKDIGPVTEWGQAKDHSKEALWPAYSDYGGGLDAFNPPFWFDTVFIDGRFRAACALKAIRATPADKISETVFAVHDYVPRVADSWEHEYHGYYYMIEHFADRFYIPESEIPKDLLDKSKKDHYKGILADDHILGLFRKKADCDEEALNEAISNVEFHQQ